MLLGGLQKTTLLDYPSKVACIVFTKGCNFRCGYCHNPELINGKEEISLSSFFDFLDKRKGKLDGVVVTGGEPTIHKDLYEFLLEIHNKGFKIKLDTNGTNPQMLIKCLPLLDYIAMDIKGPLYKYYDICGIKPNIEDVYEDITIQVYNSVDIIKNCGISYEFRTTIVEDELNVEDFKHINHLLYGAETYYLQRFTPTKTLDKSYMSRIPPKDMSPFINVLKDIKNVYVR